MQKGGLGRSDSMWWAQDGDEEALMFTWLSVVRAGPQGVTSSNLLEVIFRIQERGLE